MDLRSWARLGTTNFASIDLDRTVVQFWTWILQRDSHPKSPNSRSERTPDLNFFNSDLDLVLNFCHVLARFSTENQLWENFSKTTSFFSWGIQIWRCALLVLHWIPDMEKRYQWCRALLHIWTCRIKQVFGHSEVPRHIRSYRGCNWWKWRRLRYCKMANWCPFQPRSWLWRSTAKWCCPMIDSWHTPRLSSLSHLMIVPSQRFESEFLQSEKPKCQLFSSQLC